MAIKTFTVSSVLTAADTNTYLSNSGLVYITEASAGGSASFLDVAGCFTSTYDNYKMFLTEARTATNSAIGFQFLNGATPITTTVYAFGYTGISSLGASTTGSNTGQTYGFLMNSNLSSETGNSGTWDIINPALARRKAVIGGSQILNAGMNGFEYRTGATSMETATAYSGIRILSSGGYNLTCKIKIYGYRQA
jgi:hypothetical protein